VPKRNSCLGCENAGFWVEAAHVVSEGILHVPEIFYILNHAAEHPSINTFASSFYYLHMGCRSLYPKSTIHYRLYYYIKTK
jgi:hypothetical protein